MNFCKRVGLIAFVEQSGSQSATHAIKDYLLPAERGIKTLRAGALARSHLSEAILGPL